MWYHNGDIVKVADFYGRILDIVEDKQWFVYEVEVLRNGVSPDSVGTTVWLDTGLMDDHGRKLNKLEILVLLGLED